MSLPEINNITNHREIEIVDFYDNIENSSDDDSPNNSDIEIENFHDNNVVGLWDDAESLHNNIQNPYGYDLNDWLNNLLAEINAMVVVNESSSC